VAVYDGLMQRYNGTSYEDWAYGTPEWFIEEILSWVKGEAEADKDRKSSGVKPGEESVEVQARNAGLLMPANM
jgi:hypothetical protein